MWSYYNQTLSYLNSLTPREWFIGLIIVVALGFVCMRGFGSRHGY